MSNTKDYTNRACILGRYGFELANLIEEMPKDGIFLDIGANQGIYTLLASESLAKGRVFAFEPNPDIYAQLVANISYNKSKNTTPVNTGIGEYNRFVFFESTNTHSGRGHIQTGETFQDQIIVLMIDGMLVHNLIDSYIKKYCLCKIDTEGYELKIIQSLHRGNILSFINCLYVEINEEHLERHGDSSQDIYSLMKEVGFTWLHGPETVGHYDEIFTKA